MITRRSLPLSLSLATALVLAGCSDQGTTTPTQTAVGTQNAVTANSVILSANGQATIQRPAKGTPPGSGAKGEQSISFSAVINEDGTASGSVFYRVVSPDSGVLVTVQRGRVNCMNNIGPVAPGGPNIIIIAAQGTERVALAPPGPFPGLPPAVLPLDQGMIFAVVDKGQGATDQMTTFINTNLLYAGLLCTSPAAFGFTPAAINAAYMNNITSGGITVEP